MCLSVEFRTSLEASESTSFSQRKQSGTTEKTVRHIFGTTEKTVGHHAGTLQTFKVMFRKSKV